MMAVGFGMFRTVIVTSVFASPNGIYIVMTAIVPPLTQVAGTPLARNLIKNRDIWDRSIVWLPL